LDEPFEETGLAGTIITERKNALWKGYEKTLGENKFLGFVKALGILTKLEIQKGETYESVHLDHLCQDYYKPGVKFIQSTGKNEDYWVINISKLVTCPTIKGSKCFWAALTTAKKEVATAVYRPNKSYPVRKSESQLVWWAKNNAWVPDTQGQFYCPKDISRNELPKDFPYDDRNGLLTAIGFEENVKSLSDEYKRKNEVMKEAGFESFDQVKGLHEAMEQGGLKFEDIVELIRQGQGTLEQPVDDVGDAARRRDGVRKRGSSAPVKESVTVKRVIANTLAPMQIEARAYLRGKYTNNEGSMVCQICQHEMPFKLENGEYYFEAVEAVSTVETHIFQNRLALCPTCAAKYKHTRQTSDEDFIRAILGVDADSAGESLELELMLAGVIGTIRFVGKHFFDLNALLVNAVIEK